MPPTNTSVQQSAWVTSAAEDTASRPSGWLTPVEDFSEPTGPVHPQPHVSAPSEGLPVRRVTGTGSLWVIGAHGGAGESTIAALHEDWQPTGRTWPELPNSVPAPCVLVARTNAHGLLAARTALTQWAASAAGGSAQLLGLVLISDAPGKQPAALRDLSKVVAGGSPRVWEVPWNESWRLGDPVTERVPRPVSKIVSQLRSLTATVPTVAAVSSTKEQS